ETCRSSVGTPGAGCRAREGGARRTDRGATAATGSARSEQGSLPASGVGRRSGKSGAGVEGSGPRTATMDTTGRYQRQPSLGSNRTAVGATDRFIGGGAAANGSRCCEGDEKRGPARRGKTNIESFHADAAGCRDRSAGAPARREAGGRRSVAIAVASRGPARPAAPGDAAGLAP